MNIILAGHAPWRPTGYGVKMGLAAEMFENLGHQVTLLAVDSKGPGVIDWNGFDVYLPNHDRWGLDTIEALCQVKEAGLVISVFDPWVLPMEGYRGKNREWIGWFPVDQTPLPYHLAGQLESMAKCVTLSTWGLSRMLAEKPLLLEKCYVIPDPVDVESLRPGDWREARKLMSLPENAQVAGIVAANIAGDRKALAEQVEGWCMWARNRPDAWLLIHSDPNGAVNMIQLLREYNCQDRVIFTSDWARAYGFAEHSRLAILYRAMDVLLHASAAEGFGLCMAEALACGTPVIYNPVTSMPEVVGDCGVAVVGQIRSWSPYGGWWIRPTPEGVAQALEKFFDGGMVFPESALVKQAQQFAPERIGERWSEILA